jgi:cob(I)alamin adenosyltransferase
MKIYTKTGDDGTTGLFGGERVPKDALRIDAYGTVDELNSVIGLARCYAIDQKADAILNAIQSDLFQLGADLATPLSVSNAKIDRVQHGDCERLESWIDELDAQLPPLNNFILPGGGKPGAILHLARNVCRRAERLTVRLSHSESVGDHVIVYLNRLSDLLFVIARWVNKQQGQDEMKWGIGNGN